MLERESYFSPEEHMVGASKLRDELLRLAEADAAALSEFGLGFPEDAVDSVTSEEDLPRLILHPGLQQFLPGVYSKAENVLLGLQKFEEAFPELEVLGRIQVDTARRPKNRNNLRRIF
jgi:hypothetical protein